MATVRSLLDELTPELGQVQSRAEPWVCDTCMGPVSPAFSCCYACNELLEKGVPSQVMGAVVPASIATSPGRWYRRLLTYKDGNPNYRAHLAALAWAYLEQHEDRLSNLAGGAIDVVTPVPSKRGRTFDQHPLRQALAVVRPIEGRLANTLRFEPDAGVNLRRDYYPGCFDPGPDAVSGKRVLVVEDSWVTGATALSAAGALLTYGAVSIAILSLARVVEVDFWADSGHPYLARVLADSAQRESYDITRWLR